ncbi:MAG: glycine/sarcosine/betaine reductase complex component C subunit beta [Vulcanimicrobiaceae bacterium]
MAGKPSTASDIVPVITAVSLCLAYVPELVPYGSKPSRDLRLDPTLSARLYEQRRSYEHATGYAPNRAFIGGIDPQELWDTQPWWASTQSPGTRYGRDGEVMPQSEFYALMKVCDDFDLLWLEETFVASVRTHVADNAIFTKADLAALDTGAPRSQIEAKIREGDAVALRHDDTVIGCIFHGQHDDAALDATILLENLAAKASAVLALRHALSQSSTAPGAIEYLFGCGEEAIGDRYQRGGGSLAKSVGEKAGCVNATGSDLKAFCCAPNHAIVVGAALVKAGLFKTLAIVGGGSLAKLGMKYQGHLKHGMPILEDMLASVAIIISADDGTSPVIDLQCVGRHTIGAGSSQETIANAIVVHPLENCGLRLSDIDRFATELHNPELTEPQGTGNVPRTNYRVLALLARRRGEIADDQIDAFVRQRGMPGFSPTQGHVASSIPYLGHARALLVAGAIDTVFFYAKGSLFLGKMTRQSDGFSFLLRRNTGK